MGRCRELAAENATLKAELQALRSAVAQHLAAQAQTLQYAQAAMAAQVRLGSRLLQALVLYLIVLIKEVPP